MYLNIYQIDYFSSHKLHNLKYDKGSAPFLPHNELHIVAFLTCAWFCLCFPLLTSVAVSEG